MCLIHSYTREQALDDGELVDVTKTAKEAGFRYPTAIASTVWKKYVKVPDTVSGQDETGRLWDILYMLRVQIRKSAPNQNVVHFKLYVHNTEEKADLVNLKAVCGPGDREEPVITIMLPNED